MPPPSPLPLYLYKILSSAPPTPLPAVLSLSPLDKADGFIHLSTAKQVPATTSRFFASLDTIWLLRIELKTLEKGKGEVRWEESKSHGCFAHLYGSDIGKEEVVAVLEGKRGPTGWEEGLKGLIN